MDATIIFPKCKTSIFLEKSGLGDMWHFSFATTLIVKDKNGKEYYINFNNKAQSTAVKSEHILWDQNIFLTKCFADAYKSQQEMIAEESLINRFGEPVFIPVKQQ